MSKEPTKKAFIIRDFEDAGTQERFTGGKVQPIGVGAFGNYKFAGLVREPTGDELKVAADAEKAATADAGKAPASTAAA